MKEKERSGFGITDEEVKEVQDQIDDISNKNRKTNFELDTRIFDFEKVLGNKFFNTHKVTFERLKNGYPIKQDFPIQEDGEIKVVQKEFPMPGIDQLMVIYTNMKEQMIELNKKIKRAKKQKNKISNINTLQQIQSQFNLVRERALRVIYLYRQAIKQYSKVEYKDELVRNLLVYLFYI